MWWNAKISKTVGVAFMAVDSSAISVAQISAISVLNAVVPAIMSKVSAWMAVLVAMTSSRSVLRVVVPAAIESTTAAVAVLSA